MSMIADLDAAHARVKDLEIEVTGLKAQLAAAKAPPVKPAAPASLTPTWDRFNVIKDPAARQAFWIANEDTIRAEMKTAGKGKR